jgi:hypothetical protein
VTFDLVSVEISFDIHVSQPEADGTFAIITLHDVFFGDV